MDPNQYPNENPMNKNVVPFAIVVAGALIALAVYFGSSDSTLRSITETSEKPAAAKAEVAPVTAKDHILGNINAEVIVIEYSDTECPFCKVFQTTMRQVVDGYQGKVAWVYRHFPIAQLHPKAAKEAEATECAAELGGNQVFWRYIDRLFEITPSNDGLDPAELPKIAAAVGLNQTTFNECLSSGRYTQFVTQSVEAAVKAGARGTPYSIILAKDGRQVVVNGAEPLATVKAKIDSLLK
ncbi:MAG: thioredoxin domain-containing protein [Minisyncoccia bacterium]